MSSKHFKENEFEPNYHLTMYRLEGHKTWRVHLAMNPKGFDIEKKNWKTNAPKITDTKMLLIDRLTGEVTAKSPPPVSKAKIK